MKILWVKAGGLVPPDVGGKIRSYNILRELAQRHKVALFTFYAEHPQDVHPQLVSVFDRSICIPLKIPLARSRGERLHFLRHAFSSLPYSVAKHAQPEARSRLKDLLATDDFDVIISDFVIADAILPTRTSAPRVLFTHNVEALIWQRHLQTAESPLWKAVCWREFQRMKRFENACLRRADHVLTVSQNDLDAFAAVVPREKMSVIPTGVDTDFFRPGVEDAHTRELVFTGAMDWLANVDAMRYFVQQILPLIQHSIPGVTLTIVGRNAGPQVHALASPAVRVTGRVDDIRPYVSNAAVYIVPIRIGSGTRLKIFEAMAMGKAVVSTTIGAEGLPVQPGHNIEIADSADHFAASVVHLLRSPQLRYRLGKAARELVESRYSWSSIVSEFESTLTRVVGQSEQSRAANAIQAAGS